MKLPVFPETFDAVRSGSPILNAPSTSASGAVQGPGGKRSRFHHERETPVPYVRFRVFEINGEDLRRDISRPSRQNSGGHTTTSMPLRAANRRNCPCRWSRPERRRYRSAGRPVPLHADAARRGAAMRRDGSRSRPRRSGRQRRTKAKNVGNDCFSSHRHFDKYPHNFE